MASVVKGKKKYVARHIRATKRAYENPRKGFVSDTLKADTRAGGKKKNRKSGKNRAPYSSDWVENRTGFSPDDEYELLCQGVNPWDEDAAVSPSSHH